MATDTPKLVAVLAYVTIVGWIVALFLHQDEKSVLGTFHLRQALGLYLVWVLVGFLPAIGGLLALVVLVFWVMGLVAAIQGKRKSTPGIGDYFQQYLSFVG